MVHENHNANFNFGRAIRGAGLGAVLGGPIGAQIAGPLAGFGTGLRRTTQQDFGKITPRPDAPTFKSLLAGEDSGKLKDQYMLRYRPGGESQFETMLRERALAEQQVGDETGPLKFLLERQRGEEQMLADRVAGLGATQAAQQQAALAMRGGATGGAGERLSSQIARQGALQRQGIFAEGAQTRLGLRAAEEEQKQALQGQMANLEEQRRRINLQNVLGEIGSKRQFDMDKYKAAMREHLASKEAHEQRRLAATSGGLFGGGGILG